MQIPELLESHFGRPVAIFGFGLSGKAVAQVLNKIGLDYVVYDRIEGEGVHFTSESIGKHSLVIYSPGFIKTHPWLDLARKGGCHCLSELDFGSLFWSGKIVAITGTNGKSTLTCLLAEALKSIGKAAVACGNLGTPLCAQYNYYGNTQAIAVCEVSSFQAEVIEHFSPDTVIWTTFDEDHLDRHPDLRSYFDAKWNLIKHLKTEDFFIGETVLKYSEQFGYTLPKETSVIYQSEILGNKKLPNGIFSMLPQSENYLLALAYWISQGFNSEDLRKIAISFRPLPHRLKKIAKINGIGFWNDSKGTNFSATTSALKSFQKPVFWVGGGKIKGGDQRGFTKAIAPYIEEAFLIGESAPILKDLFTEHAVKVLCYPTMEEAIDEAFSRASLGGKESDIVFSPGYSSFDMFRNAEERGIFFERKVLELKREQNALDLT